MCFICGGLARVHSVPVWGPGLSAFPLATGPYLSPSPRSRSPDEPCAALAAACTTLAPTCTMTGGGVLRARRGRCCRCCRCRRARARPRHPLPLPAPAPAPMTLDLHARTRVRDGPRQCGCPSRNAVRRERGASDLRGETGQFSALGAPLCTGREVQWVPRGTPCVRMVNFSLCRAYIHPSRGGPPGV